MGAFNPPTPLKHNSVKAKPKGRVRAPLSGNNGPKSATKPSTKSATKSATKPATKPTTKPAATPKPLVSSQPPAKSDPCRSCKRGLLQCLKGFFRVDESCDDCLKAGKECEVDELPDEERESEPAIGHPLQDVNPHILSELKHLDLSGHATFDNNNVVGGGAYGDICKTYCTPPKGSSRAVAMKRLRFYLPEDIILLFEKELYVWSKLKHINILPLLGYAFDDTLTRYPVLVSEWMSMGSAWDYINGNPDCNPTRLVRGIARGLQYMHDQNVVHSDLKADNVLVSPSRDARICDFGCSRMLAASRSLANMSTGIKGTTRYWAYELLNNPESGASQESMLYTKKTDIWAFGMTVYELLEKKRPYGHLPEAQVLLAISRQQLPSLSPPLHPHSSLRMTVRDILWDLCQRCWAFNPEDRANIDVLLGDFEKEIKPHDVRILRNYFPNREIPPNTPANPYSLSFLASLES